MGGNGWLWFVLGVGGVLAGGCASGGRCVEVPAAEVVAGDVYDLEALAAAFAARGVKAREQGEGLEAWFEELELEVFVQPVPDSELLRVFTGWPRDPAVPPDVRWLEKVNTVNADGIVKVYLDEGLNVVVEMYVDVLPGTTTARVARLAELFAMRASNVGSTLVEYVR